MINLGHKVILGVGAFMAPLMASLPNVEAGVSAAASLGGVGLLLMMLNYFRRQNVSQETRILELLKKLQESQNKCDRCRFVKAANDEFFEKRNLKGGGDE